MVASEPEMARSSLTVRGTRERRIWAMAYANRRRTYREGYRAGERGTIALSARALWLPDKQRAMPLTDAAFHLDEGRTLHGSVSWTEATSVRTRASHPSISLAGTYPLKWHRYSTVTPENGKERELRWLMVVAAHVGIKPKGV